MALTRHSVRACLLWSQHEEDLGLGGDARRRWNHFLRCLQDVQLPSPSDPRRFVEQSVKRFLQDLVAEPNRGREALALESDLRESPPVEVLQAWQQRNGRGEDVPRLLFAAPLDRGAAAFYLGQLAFLFGQLRLAKSYAVEAYWLLQKNGVQEEKKPLSLRLFEFLTVTLLLEVSFHSEGYDTFRDSDGRPQARRIYVELTQGKPEYLKDFPLDSRLTVLTAGNGDASRHNGGGKLEGFVKHFWLPIPTKKDIEPLEIESESELLALEPFALAYVLSKKNRAGMLLFRYREWRAAEDEFSRVLEVLEEKRAADTWDAMLTPLEHESRLFLGRLKARACEFAEAAQEIAAAQDYFAAIGDEFANNKAHKARAELAYRQHHWRTAEMLFSQVWEESRNKGFAHDRATAEMHLGKILSRFGFQSDAEALFAGANDHFRQYDVLRETIECLFWQAATRARRIDLTGHRREDAIGSRALIKVYRKLFEWDSEASAEQSEALMRLREALRYKRRPDIAEVLLDLRLGSLPRARLIRSLEAIVDSNPPPKLQWHEAVQARFSLQLLRLIRLQDVQERRTVGRIGQRAVASEHDAMGLRKFTIRDHVLSALEWTLRPRRPGDLAPVCLALQEAHRQIKHLGMGGGLVPFWVDLSQFFIDRDCFIALLLVQLDAVDRAIRAPEKRSVGRRRLEADILKMVYRSFVKYLVLERNFYVGPPPFTGRRNRKLWTTLQDQYRAPDWASLYRAALKGDHGISYPPHSVALGWVESVATGGASLRVFWVTDCLGRELRHDDFQSIEVPIGVVEQGHAQERMSPIVLIGRHEEMGDGSSHRPWTAHRIPLELPLGELFVDLEPRRPPWYLPHLEVWQQVFRRFTGQDPAICKSPKVTAQEVESRYAEEVLHWFGDLFSPTVFERLFAVAAAPAVHTRTAARGQSSPAPGDGESVNGMDDVNRVFSNFPSPEATIPDGVAVQS